MYDLLFNGNSIYRKLTPLTGNAKRERGGKTPSSKYPLIRSQGC